MTLLKILKLSYEEIEGWGYRKKIPERGVSRKGSSLICNVMLIGKKHHGYRRDPEVFLYFAPLLRIMRALHYTPCILEYKKKKIRILKQRYTYTIMIRFICASRNT